MTVISIIRQSESSAIIVQFYIFVYELYKKKTQLYKPSVYEISSASHLPLIAVQCAFCQSAALNVTRSYTRINNRHIIGDRSIIWWIFYGNGVGKQKIDSACFNVITCRLRWALLPRSRPLNSVDVHRHTNCQHLRARSEKDAHLMLRLRFCIKPMHNTAYTYIHTYIIAFKINRPPSHRGGGLQQTELSPISKLPDPPLWRLCTTRTSFNSLIASMAINMMCL